MYILRISWIYFRCERIISMLHVALHCSILITLLPVLSSRCLKQLKVQINQCVKSIWCLKVFFNFGDGKSYLIEKQTGYFHGYTLFYSKNTFNKIIIIFIVISFIFFLFYLVDLIWYVDEKLIVFSLFAASWGN